MISVKVVHFAISLLTLFLAYMVIVSPVGWFRAWVAKKMGDSTGEDLGFLTLNPGMHVDVVGVVVLFLFGAGWGRHIPINPLNILGPRRGLKLTAAYFSDTLAHLLLASAALALFIFLFGVQSLGFYATNFSSLSISVSRIIIAVVRLNVFLAAIGFVINGVMLIGLYIAERHIQIPSYFFYFIVLTPILVLVIFGEDIRHFMMCGVTLIGEFFARICGVR